MTDSTLTTTDLTAIAAAVRAAGELRAGLSRLRSAAEARLRAFGRLFLATPPPSDFDGVLFEGEPVEITELLGEGGFAFVHRATVCGRAYALKTLRPERASDEFSVSLFKAEARLLRELRGDPGFVAHVAHGRLVDGRLAIAMEIVHGCETLEAYVDRVGAPERSTIVSVMTAVLLALKSLHVRRRVHGDLTGRNILRSDEGRFLICDLGAAVSFDIEERAKAGIAKLVVGAKGRMPAEQLRGGRLDARTDVYGAGCLMAEMVVGRCALMRLMKADARSVDIAGLGALSPVAALFRPIIKIATARDPDDRHQSVDLLRLDIELAARG